MHVRLYASYSNKCASHVHVCHSVCVYACVLSSLGRLLGTSFLLFSSRESWSRRHCCNSYNVFTDGAPILFKGYLHKILLNYPVVACLSSFTYEITPNLPCLILYRFWFFIAYKFSNLASFLFKPCSLIEFFI